MVGFPEQRNYYAAASPGQKIDPNAVLSPADFRKKIVVQQAKFQTPPRRNNRDSYELDREEYSSSDADSDSGSDSNSEAQREEEVAEEVPETDSVEDDDDESMKRPYSARDEAIEEKNVAEQTAQCSSMSSHSFTWGIPMKWSCKLAQRCYHTPGILHSPIKRRGVWKYRVPYCCRSRRSSLLRLFLSSRASADVNVTNGTVVLHVL